jgi:hypothetical protein
MQSNLVTALTASPSADSPTPQPDHAVATAKHLCDPHTFAICHAALRKQVHTWLLQCLLGRPWLLQMAAASL